MRRALLLLLALAFAAPAAAKSLYWRSLDVTARLDAAGQLRVRERQTMVFDGDWNGGERRFDVRQGQTLDINGVTRIEGSKEVPLAEGNLSDVDHYAMNEKVLRWRSRLPSDPPFENREIVYVIDYTLGGILNELGDNEYELDHDLVVNRRMRYAGSQTIASGPAPVSLS